MSRVWSWNNARLRQRDRERERTRRGKRARLNMIIPIQTITNAVANTLDVDRHGLTVKHMYKRASKQAIKPHGFMTCYSVNVITPCAAHLYTSYIYLLFFFTSLAFHLFTFQTRLSDTHLERTERNLLMPWLLAKCDVKSPSSCFKNCNIHLKCCNWFEGCLCSFRGFARAIRKKNHLKTTQMKNALSEQQKWKKKKKTTEKKRAYPHIVHLIILNGMRLDRVCEWMYKYVDCVLWKCNELQVDVCQTLILLSI